KPRTYSFCSPTKINFPRTTGRKAARGKVLAGEERGGSLVKWPLPESGIGNLVRRWSGLGRIMLLLSTLGAFPAVEAADGKGFRWLSSSNVPSRMICPYPKNAFSRCPTRTVE